MASNPFLDGPPRATYDHAFAAESRVPMIYGVTIASAIVGTLFTGARCYCRAKMLKAWRLDDTITLMTWATLMGMTVINCMLAQRGIGRHIGAVPGALDLDTVSKLSFSGQMIYQAGLALSRLALCTLYLNIFTDRFSHRVLYGLIIFTSVGFLVIELMSLFRCKPVYLVWASPDKIPLGRCLDSVPLFLAAMLYNVVSDILIMIFVSARFLQLQISVTQKVILVGIVCVGILVIATSISRFLVINQFNKTADVPWLFAEILVWSSIEMAAAIICTCAPTIRPLMRKIIPGSLFSTAIPSTGRLTVPSTGVSTEKPKSRNLEWGKVSIVDEFELASHGGSGSEFQKLNGEESGASGYNWSRAVEVENPAEVWDGTNKTRDQWPLKKLSHV